MTLENAIQRLAPGYVLNDHQRDQIARNTDPTAAKDLPGVVESIARSLADNAETPFDWRLIPTEFIMDEIDFSLATNGYHLGWNSTAQMFGSPRVFAIGKIVGRTEQTPLAAIYRAVLGREPDAAGLAFWQGHYDDGMPLSDVIRYIEQSPEAQGG